MSARARRYFGCVMPLVLVVFGCGSCLLAGLAGRVFAEVMVVQDDAMAPLLEPGTEALVVHAVIWTAEPFVGQVTAVRREDGSRTFRRIVAEPGDTVEVRDGIVYLGGERMEPTESRRGEGPDFGPLTLGAEEYFYLSDDRDQPDSRQWGPIHRDRVLGEVMFVSPPGEDGLLPSQPFDAGYDPEWLEKVDPDGRR